MWQYLRWNEWLQKAMSDGKSGFPSTKRLGYMTGIFVAATVALVMLGIVIGLSIGVSAVQYQFVYSTLTNTILIVIGMLVTGSSAAYIATKRTEQNDQPK